MSEPQTEASKEEQQPVEFDCNVLFPNRRVRKAYRKYISPMKILSDVDDAERAMIMFLESAGRNQTFVRVYGELGKYEQERSIAINEIMGTDPENEPFQIQWVHVRDEIDDSILEPLQNIGKVVKSVDFYRQDMELVYGMPISDAEERQDMLDEVEMISELVKRQCFEVKNNIRWLEDQLG